MTFGQTPQAPACRRKRGRGRVWERAFLAWITIDPRLHDDAAIALLGHELQRAWEIAQAPWVIDQETVRTSSGCVYKRRIDTTPGRGAVPTRPLGQLLPRGAVIAAVLVP